MGDEREVEIGDRIRVLTSAGSWQTRTVDSVTYDNYQVTGFVVSEPYESETVSVGAALTGVTAATDGKYTKASHGTAITGAGEAVKVYKAHLAYNDGAGTTEASECSGRGLCDDSSGECQCFKGYTGVDCSIQ